MRLFVLPLFVAALFFYSIPSFAGDFELEPINSFFIEPPKCDFHSDKCGRYKVRNVNIAGEGNVVYSNSGGFFNVTMEIRHDCKFCGNAINQIIVGLSSDDKAQISVWNGKQRSGGGMRVVNPGTSVASPAHDKFDGAEWVKVYFQIDVPDEKGVYYLRTRYSQAYTGNVLTHQDAQFEQKIATEPLKWWKVDRPNGPSSKSNIGAFVIQ